MRTAWLICRKDLKRAVRDRSALLVGIVVPLALAFIFNAVFSGAASGNVVISLGVVDRTGARPRRRSYTTCSAGSPRAGSSPCTASLTGRAPARLVVASGITRRRASIIPPGFSAAVQGEPAGVAGGDRKRRRCRSRPRSPDRLPRATRRSSTVSASLSRQPWPEAGPHRRTRRSQSSGRRRDPGGRRRLASGTCTTATKELNAKSFYAAGMAVFFLFFTVGFGVTGLLEERTNGTLARLVAAPITAVGDPGGEDAHQPDPRRVSMAVLVVATTVLFGASWGNPLGVGSARDRRRAGRDGDHGPGRDRRQERRNRPATGSLWSP